MAEEIMIQDNIPICHRCSGAMRKIFTQNGDIFYVCVDNKCKSLLKVIDYGQSCRELKCEVVK